MKQSTVVVANTSNVTKFNPVMKPLALAIFSIFAVSNAGTALSAVVNWTGATGSWQTAANWSSTPLLPGVADDVVVNIAGAQTVTTAANATINNLTIGSAVNPTNKVTLSAGVLRINNLTNIVGGSLQFLAR
jgi:hypothetical protein